MFKYYFFFALFVGTTLPLSAQITLNADNYGSRDSVILLDTLYYVNDPQPAVPQAGENQTWDYSALQLDDFYVNTYREVPEEDTCIIGAQIQIPITFSFQAFSYPGIRYLAYEESGRFNLGIKTDGAKFPLTLVTGSNLDTLAILPRVEARRETQIPFPATYGTIRRDSYNLTAALELSVAAFGLNRTPAAQHADVSRTSEVIGYGDLILPALPGAPSEPLEALLIKTTTVDVVTYTLAGGPAPPTLLQAFGARQNDTTTSVVYFFHVKGIGQSAARLQINSGEADYSFEFRRVQPGITTSVNRFSSPRPLQFFPNPVSPGEELRLTGQMDLTSGTVRLLDPQGRTVTEKTFSTLSGDVLRLHIPEELSPGLYFQQVVDQHGRLLGMGKVVVR